MTSKTYTRSSESDTIGKFTGTISLSLWGIGAVKRILRFLDTRECYLGREVGTTGYLHIQFCIDCGCDLEQYNSDNSLGWHVERAISWHECINYCRKENNYAYIGDSIEERAYRFIGTRQLRNVQQDILQSIDSQNDRKITVWIDRQGCIGKSTLLYIMERRGVWFSIPRTEQSANRINDFVAMHYKNEECIVLDLARQRKLSEAQAEVLEDIKDGLVKSSKYEGTSRFIKGVKVLVFTNQWIEPKVYKTLTEDRWDIRKVREG